MLLILHARFASCLRMLLWNSESLPVSLPGSCGYNPWSGCITHVSEFPSMAGGSCILPTQQAKARLTPAAFVVCLQAGVPKARIVTAVLDPVRDDGGDVASAIVRYSAAYKARSHSGLLVRSTVCGPCAAHQGCLGGLDTIADATACLVRCMRSAWAIAASEASSRRLASGRWRARSWKMRHAPWWSCDQLRSLAHPERRETFTAEVHTELY